MDSARESRFRSSRHAPRPRAAVDMARGSTYFQTRFKGRVPERPKGAGCKPAGVCLRGFESLPAHLHLRRHRDASDYATRRPPDRAGTGNGIGAGASYDPGSSASMSHASAVATGVTRSGLGEITTRLTHAPNELSSTPLAAKSASQSRRSTRYWNRKSPAGKASRRRHHPSSVRLSVWLVRDQPLNSPLTAT